MSTSEAETAVDQKRYFAATVATGVLSAVSGVAWTIWVTADAIERGVPDRLITGLLVLAATLALTTLVVHIAYRRASLQGELIAAVGSLAAELEQVSAKLNVDPADLPDGVAAQIYQLGQRAGSRGAN